MQPDLTVQAFNPKRQGQADLSECEVSRVCMANSRPDKVRTDKTSLDNKVRPYVTKIKRGGTRGGVTRWLGSLVSKGLGHQA